MNYGYFPNLEPLRKAGSVSASQPQPCQEKPRSQTPNKKRTAACLIIWTDPKADGSADPRTCRAFVPLPIGVARSACLRCGSSSVVGALITETADECDPNMLCLNCNYWRD